MSAAMGELTRRATILILDRRKKQLRPGFPSSAGSLDLVRLE